MEKKPLKKALRQVLVYCGISKLSPVFFTYVQVALKFFFASFHHYNSIQKHLVKAKLNGHENFQLKVHYIALSILEPFDTASIVFVHK